MRDDEKEVFGRIQLSIAGKELKLKFMYIPAERAKIMYTSGKA